MHRRRRHILTGLCIVLSFGNVALRGAAAPAPASDGMDAIRSSYLELRRDVLLAEPAPIVPRAGQIAVYVTVSADAKATLQAAALSIDDALVCHERFSDAQLEALQRGAAGRLYVSTTAAGPQLVSITLAGLRRDGEPWAQSASVALPGSVAPRYVEFQLTGTTTKGVPDIVSRVST